MATKHKLWHLEHCNNGRTHLWLCGIKIFSWGARKTRPFKNPKLGISYSVWDGEELLEQSIRQIRPIADYINVVWQKLSWYGKPCNPSLERTLLKLQAKGLIDEIIFFEPDFKQHPVYNEVDKRNVGLLAARRHGCTHFMTMDTDEFYDTDQFRAAYDTIISQNLSHTVCNIVSYLTPTLRYKDYEDFFVLFICKINKGERLILSCLKENLPVHLDPTRQIPLRRHSRFCFMGKIIMHHMTHVRHNIHKKIDNSSMNYYESGQKKLREKYLKHSDSINAGIQATDYIRVKNKFNIKI